MKKDRNCGCGGPTPYPVYPNYPGMGVMPVGNMQGFGGAMPYPMPTPMPINQPGYNNQGMNNGNTQNERINRLEQQVQNLDRRVSRLESMSNNHTTNNFTANQYTDANYHVM